jgi:hypothetical protein
MRLPLLSISLFLALAAPAAADSVVYTKDANVWVARPDGSEARQVTRDGGSQSPSQADDGTILAVRGDKLYKLDRQGRQLAVFGSVLTGKPGSIGAVGPFDARISPDGTKIAYWLGIMGGWYDYSTGTYYTDPQSAINYQSAADGSQLGSTMFYEEPSWLADSQRVLLWDSINGGVPQAVTGAVGMNHNQLTGWFHDLDVFDDPGGWKPTGAGELSRVGTRLAALRARATMGAGGQARGAWNAIQIYDVHGLTTAPAGACFIADETGKEFGPPSWSPGADQIAFARPDGIYTSPVCGVAPKLVIAGGNEPDWGPADPGPAAGPEPTPQPQPNPQAKLAAAKLRGRTLKLTVSCPAACRVDAVAKRGRKVVGRGKGRAKQAGAVKVTLKLRGRGKVALTAKVRLGATTQTLTKTVR